MIVGTSFETYRITITSIPSINYIYVVDIKVIIIHQLIEIPSITNCQWFRPLDLQDNRLTFHHGGRGWTTFGCWVRQYLNFCLST